MLELVRLIGHSASLPLPKLTQAPYVNRAACLATYHYDEKIAVSKMDLVLKDIDLNELAFSRNPDSAAITVFERRP